MKTGSGGEQRDGPVSVSGRRKADMSGQPTSPSIHVLSQKPLDTGAHRDYINSSMARDRWTRR